MMDTNFQDAKHEGQDLSHNICRWYCKKWTENCCTSCDVYDYHPCYGIEPGRGSDDMQCHNFFRKQWDASVQMVRDVLLKKTADWHIIVSHFPHPSISSQ